MAKSRQHGSPKVFVCDDHVAVRRGIRAILDETDMALVGEADTVQDTLAHATEPGIDVFIVGLNLGEARGVTLLDLLRERNGALRMLVYSANDDIPIVSAAYEHGARGYVTKSAQADLLIEAIRAIAAGKTYFMPGVAEELAIYHTSGAREEDPRQRLNERELSIFVMLAEGFDHAEIGQHLGITEKTVANRAVTIRHKLGIRREDFTSYAANHQLIDPPHQAAG